MIIDHAFKQNQNKKPKIPGGWENGFPDSKFEIVNRSNYLDFIT